MENPLYKIKIPASFYSVDQSNSDMSFIDPTEDQLKEYTFIQKSLFKNTYIDQVVAPPKLAKYSNVVIDRLQRRYPRDNNKTIIKGNFYVLPYFPMAYGHLLIEMLGPFLYAKALVPDLNILFLVGHPKHSEDQLVKTNIETLEKIGIKYIFAEDLRDILVVESLYYLIPEKDFGFDEYSLVTTHPALLTYTTRKALKPKNFSNKQEHKIYMSRRYSNFMADTPRKVKNEEVLENFFRDKGYSIIYNERLSLEEQIELYGNAKEVIGLSGTGFTNLLWCEEGTKVVEITQFIPHIAFEWVNIANAANLDYHCVGMGVEDDAHKIIEKFNYVSNLISVK